MLQILSGLRSLDDDSAVTCCAVILSISRPTMHVQSKACMYLHERLYVLREFANRSVLNTDTIDIHGPSM